jgi:hypothetical protein
MRSGMKTTQSSRFPQFLRVHVEVDVEAVSVTQRGGNKVDLHIVCLEERLKAWQTDGIKQKSNG